MQAVPGPFKPLAALLRRFHRDNRGAVSILATFLILLGLIVSSMVIDVGHLYLAKRRLQSAVDAAALAAAANPSGADAIAARVLAINGFSDSRLTVETGTYTADTTPGATRFVAGGGNSNAVRVTQTVTTNNFLAAMLHVARLSDVQATATATQRPAVSFSAGTTLAQLDAGNLNAVLGGLLGTNLNLTLLNYQGLAATNISALAFLNQLATDVSATAGTYGDLANVQVTLGQIIATAQTVLQVTPGGGAAATALQALAPQVPGSASALLNAVIDTALWQKRQIGSIVQQSGNGDLSINLFDLIASAARVYGAGHIADLGTALTLPLTGTSISAKMTVGQQMASTALAPVGTSIGTSQVRLALTVTAAHVDLGVVSATVSLPLYLQIASGQATVTAIPCNTDGTMATISAAAQAAAIQIGAVSDAALADFSHVPAPATATIANVTLSIPLVLTSIDVPVAIKADGSASILAGTPADLDFTQDDITQGTPHSVAGSDGGQLFSDFYNTIHLSTQLPGGLTGIVTGAVNTLLSGTLMPLLKPVLASLLSALDPAVDTLLRTLGLRLGAMDVVLHGASCSGPVLVG